ncbi:hypothetical protein Mapa_008077 [Marchantia paleacea]|nr:hypothetical protein Mapa_008077 [Marchantia paleacea]
MAVAMSMASSSLCLSGVSGVNVSTIKKGARIGGGSGSSWVARRTTVPRLRSSKSLKVIAGLADPGKEQHPVREKFGSGFFLVLESLGRSLSQMGEKLGNVVPLPKFKPQTEEELQLLTALKGRMVCAAAPLFFAAISQSAPVNTPLTVVASGMAKWLELYSGVLMVRVLLSWFPNIPWERQPLQAMRDMCDPYLNLFRNIIPPLFNALDLSPMLAFLVLGVLTSILNTTVQSG